VFNEVIKYFDCSILFGHRSPDEQFELYKKGRKEVNGKWYISNRREVVTYKDGINNKSRHNNMPSDAIDAAPYPIDWKDTDRVYYFAGLVMGIAASMGIKLRWGGDWDRDTEVNDQTFNDLYHFEVVE
jgi:peptidoglycan L-alanyl-D-glutamate endopeptidase CwlK